MSSSSREEKQKNLPVYLYRDVIISTVLNNPLVLIVGETGSGKTTQIPQYLLSLSFKNKNGKRIVTSKNRIVCTQPRTVAATTVADRVSKELDCELGKRVGYQVRLDQKISENETELVYMTEGSLLRKAMSSSHKNFLGYSVVIIDEAHERTVNADLLMGFLKKTIISNIRKDNFHVIIMSATLDTKRFLTYFNNPPLINIPGNLYPITRYFLKKPSDDYLESTVNIVYSIHNSNISGDILVFLTGAQEIDECVDRINTKINNNSNNNSYLKIHPLYSQMSKDKQDEAIFKNKNNNIRRCIVATNIAETSLTIEGIVFVIDCGFSKQKMYNPQKAVEALGIRPISKASVKQRLGRAGRTRNGYVYHLYTFDGYKSLRNETQAEIMRSSLINETLSMLALGIKNPLTFDYIDPPSEMTLARALNTLYALEAINNSGIITYLGKNMAKFPVDPRLAKSILKSKEYYVINEVLSICSMLEVKDKLFFRPRRDENNCSNYKRKIKYWSHIDGDHLTLLNIYNAFEQKKNICNNNYNELHSFCKDNFWDFRSLKRALQIRGQLERVLYNIEQQLLNNKINNKLNNKIIINCLNPKNKYYYNNIIKSLLSGHFLNVSVQGFSGKYWIFRIVELNEKHSAIEVLDKASPHPSSVFHKGPKRNWIMFHEVVIQQVTHLRCLTAIKPSWLLEVAPHYYNVKNLQKDKSAIAQILKSIQNNNNSINNNNT